MLGWSSPASPGDAEHGQKTCCCSRGQHQGTRSLRVLGRICCAVSVTRSRPITCPWSHQCHLLSATHGRVTCVPVTGWWHLAAEHLSDSVTRSPGWEVSLLQEGSCSLPSCKAGEKRARGQAESRRGRERMSHAAWLQPPCSSRRCHQCGQASSRKGEAWGAAWLPARSPHLGLPSL